MITAENFNTRITVCDSCPRLRDWCRHIAETKVKRHEAEEYWGKPVPSFGAMDARLVIVGLAPGAHGSNRTGRMFTGDQSGDWLFRALHQFGFCSRVESVSRKDGMRLLDTRITAVAHCAPPANKLTPMEIDECSGFLSRELELLTEKRVVIALGSVAYKRVGMYFAPVAEGRIAPFAHGASFATAQGVRVIASYHPSQQNTFTRKLTGPMFAEIFATSREILSSRT